MVWTPKAAALALLCAGMIFAGCSPDRTTESAQPANDPTQAVQGIPPGDVNQQVATQPSSTAPTGPIDGPLSVVIESPADNATVRQSPLEISGQADAGTVITINNTILLVNDDRRFRATIELVEGINIIEIVASDLEENQEAFYLTVDYQQ